MESWGNGRIPLPDWVSDVSPNVRYISLVKCAETGRVSRGRTRAHVHRTSGFMSIFRKEARNLDYPTVTFLHEAAHADTPGTGHGRKWRERFATLRREWLDDDTTANQLRISAARS